MLGEHSGADVGRKRVCRAENTSKSAILHEGSGRVWAWKVDNMFLGRDWRAQWEDGVSEYGYSFT